MIVSWLFEYLPELDLFLIQVQYLNLSLKIISMKVRIAILLAMLSCCLTLTTIAHDVGFTALCSQRVNSLTRVEELVNVTYIYSLQHSNQYVWSQFPDMNVPFKLDYAQYVLISYRINNYAPLSYFITRVKIDGVENQFFRDISSGTTYRSNSGSKQVYLSEGQHTVVVEYRQDGQTLNNVFADWNCAWLSIEYYTF